MEHQNSSIDPGLIVPNSNVNKLTLREVINFLEFMRLSQSPTILVGEINSIQGGVADWDLECSEDGQRWVITIPEWCIAPLVRPILKSIGFKCLASFYYLSSHMGDVDDPIDTSELNSWTLIPDKWIKQGCIDGEVVDSFRATGHYPVWQPQRTTNPVLIN